MHKQIAVTLLLIAHTTFSTAFAAKQPNFVFFLVDDLGWADVGCFGSEFHRTPHIDALAASGMKFTSGYAACPVCSPTRASIMTGRHPVRVDITDWIPGARNNRNPKFLHVDDRNELALEEVTIAEVLKADGYETFFAGKWHLGSDGFLPTDQGFDFNIGGHHRGSPPGGYHAPFKNPQLKNKESDTYLTKRMTDECVNFLTARDADRPFFMYMSYYNVHTPIQPYPDRINEYRDRAKEMFGDTESEPITERGGQSRSRQDNPEFASMVSAVDDSVGAILTLLRTSGLDNDTVIIFFSDNGGLCTKPKPGPTSNLPLRSGKGWLYEGGIREPMIVSVPGITKPGSVCDQPVVSMDFFPTILELAGLKLQPNLHADGVSLLPTLRGEEQEHDAIYWHYPHYHGSTWAPGAAIRDGDWKLIELYEYDETELYNVRNDIGEQNNLAAKHPEKVQELSDKLKKWQAKMNAKMPQPNPKYQPGGSSDRRKGKSK